MENLLCGNSKWLVFWYPRDRQKDSEILREKSGMKRHIKCSNGKRKENVEEQQLHTYTHIFIQYGMPHEKWFSNSYCLFIALLCYHSGSSSPPQPPPLSLSSLVLLVHSLYLFYFILFLVLLCFVVVKFSFWNSSWFWNQAFQLHPKDEENIGRTITTTTTTKGQHEQAYYSMPLCCTFDLKHCKKWSWFNFIRGFCHQTSSVKWRKRKVEPRKCDGGKQANHLAYNRHWIMSLVPAMMW